MYIIHCNQRPYPDLEVTLFPFSDTNIFTDKAFIRISGPAAAGTKRTIIRLDWARCELGSVGFETAGIGATDLDCEVKFIIGGHQMSIDVAKAQQLEAIKIYRLLTKLCMVQQENVRLLNFTSKLPAIHVHLSDGSDAGTAMTSAVSQYVNEMVAKFDPVSYKAVFDDYWLK